MKSTTLDKRVAKALQIKRERLTADIQRIDRVAAQFDIKPKRRKTTRKS